MKIINAIDLGDKSKEKLCKVFIDAFYDEFKDISKDRIKLYKSFEHIFLVERFNVAIINNEVAGLIACTDGFYNSMNINSKIFRKEFGFIKGSIIAMILKKNFQKKPIKRGQKEGFIEIVATSPGFQKRGVGTALINFVFDIPEFDSYILEVASNNPAGISLYQKLGFNEIDRKNHIFAKQSGIDYFIWMEYKLLKEQLFCDFCSHEILKIEDDFIYLYKSDDHSREQGSKEISLMEALANDLPVLDPRFKEYRENRIGFKIFGNSIDLLAFEIRQNQDNLHEYATRLANIMIELHQVNLSSTKIKSLNIKSLDRFKDRILEIEYLTEYKDRLLEIYSNIGNGSSLCHLDLGPYHILNVDGEDKLLDLHSLSIGNPMADIAKTIFWVCSGYVPGIGTYLKTEQAKRDFVKFYIDRYRSKLKYNQEEVNQWLVIFAALEFNEEFPEEGLTDDLKAMRDLVEDYFAGKQVDYPIVYNSLCKPSK